jgi:uncharacterized protein with HEPN domain
MSKRDVSLFAFDLLVASLKIKKVASSYKNANELKHDFVAWDSIIREFEIIGEAAKHLIEAEIFTQKQRAVVDFRNLLIHAYFGIDEDEVWNIIQSHLHQIQNDTIQIIQKIDTEHKAMLIQAFIEENKHLDFLVDALKNL